MSLKQKCWIGVDGTRTGWVAFVLKDDGNHQLWHIKNLQDLQLLTNDLIEAIAIDIPIGLLEIAEKGGRGCDREARRLLSSAKRNNIEKNKIKSSHLPIVGPSSIFTPPCRKAMEFAFNDKGSTICCCTHAQVSSANKNSVLGIEGSKDDTTTSTGEGLGLSIQTFHILPKIKEADNLVRSSKAHARAFDTSIPVLECHPELAFLALSLKDDKGDNLGKAKALYSKKIIQGRRKRLELLCKKAHLDANKLLSLVVATEASEGVKSEGILDKLSQLRTWRISSLSNQNDEKESVAADDVLDAIVCASTSRRWSLGQAKAVSEDANIIFDNRKLPMLIWA